MSVRVMSWVFEAAPTQDATEQIVLLAIADRCDDEGLSAYPSVTTLAKKTRLAARTVVRTVKRLQTAGVLNVQRGAGRKGTNQYSVVMTPCRKVTPDTASPLTDSHLPPDTETPPLCQRITPSPVTRSPDPSGTSHTSRTSAAVRRMGRRTDESELDRRAGAFLERYPELYAKWRAGATYRVSRINQDRDLDYARDLVTGWPDPARLEAMLEVFLRRDDVRDKNNPGTPGQFLHLAPDCDRWLREHGR